MGVLALVGALALAGCTEDTDRTGARPRRAVTVTWAEHPLPAPAGAPGRTVVRDAVQCGAGWWVVGAVFLDHPTETRDTRPAAWFSTDRATWTSVDVGTHDVLGAARDPQLGRLLARPDRGRRRPLRRGARQPAGDHLPRRRRPARRRARPLHPVRRRHRHQRRTDRRRTDRLADHRQPDLRPGRVVHRRPAGVHPRRGRARPDRRRRPGVAGPGRRAGRGRSGCWSGRGRAPAATSTRTRSPGPRPTAWRGRRRRCRPRTACRTCTGSSRSTTAGCWRSGAARTGSRPGCATTTAGARLRALRGDRRLLARRALRRLAGAHARGGPGHGQHRRPLRAVADRRRAVAGGRSTYRSSRRRRATTPWWPRTATPCCSSATPATAATSGAGAIAPARVATTRPVVQCEVAPPTRGHAYRCVR